MSDKFNAAIALAGNTGFLDFTEENDLELAKCAMSRFGYSRYEYSRETDDVYRLEKNEIAVFATKAGLLSLSYDFAEDIAFNGNRAKLVASKYARVIGVIYNDQCLVDVMSYFENGKLIRRVCDMDGYDKDDVISEGELLDEEKVSLRNETPDPEYPIDELSHYEFDGKTYSAEGNLPMLGVGLAVAKRFLGTHPLDIWDVPRSSVFVRKPWWQRW